MTAPSEQLSLAGDFPAASLEQWQALVATTLAKTGRTGTDSDGPPEAALASTSPDGIRISPLYTAAQLPYPLDDLGVPGSAPFVRGARAGRSGWDVRQRHLNADVDATRRAVIADLENGVTSLWLLIGSRGIAVTDLAAVLSEVLLELAPIVLDAGAETAAAASALVALARSRGLEPSQLRGSFGVDPIGLAAKTGSVPDLAPIAELVNLVAGFDFMLLSTVDATIYHEAGGNDSDELAIAASIGVAYLRELTATGLDIDTALARLEFRYCVSDDQFAGIAKLRAGRRIWARIAELAGAAAAGGQRQHAVSSPSMMTQRDPWVNILRTTIACFAGAVGGAESITVAGFDEATGLSDDFARRIARNTQSILHDESSLARVLDPAGGSWYVESLTEELSKVAWQKFTELEAAGGAAAALKSGAMQTMLALSRDSKVAAIRHRRDPITGVSEFPLLSEVALERQPGPDQQTAGLGRLRYAQVFESLRDRSDDQLARTGSRPVVFLAALGPRPAHTARLEFARNLFEAGGIEVIAASGDQAALVEAFSKSGATVACLCSADKVYAEQAADTATALRASGALAIWIAGAPTLIAGDIDAALYAGCDAAAVLETVLNTLGVS